MPTLKRIGEELFRGAPDWFRRFLAVLNPFLDAVYLALSRQLTFQENIASQIREFTFTTKSTYTSGDFDVLRFSTGLSERAIGVVLLQVNEIADSEPVIQSAVSLNWIESQGSIVVRYVAGLENSKKYGLRLLIV